MAQAAAAGRAELRADVSWIGNSFSGKEAWVLQDVEDIFVAPDGTLWTNVYWDEAGGNVQQYKDGRLVAMARHTHGWGYEGGAAVAANAKYLFIVQNVNNEGGGLRGHSWPAKGFTWSGISRRLRTDITKPAAFADGRGKEGDVLPGAFLPVVEVPDGKQGSLRGLGATDTRLFVSSPFDNAIKVYDTETMRPIKSWALERPGPLCLDRAGQVWVLQGPAAEGGAWKALSFTAEGSPRGASIAFPQGVLPTDLCADKDGRLLVADAGPAQQVLLYEGLDGAPKPAGTFGAKGGILADPPGKFGDRRFNRPHGVGTDDQGRVYVASSGSSALETGGAGAPSWSATPPTANACGASSASTSLTAPTWTRTPTRTCTPRKSISRWTGRARRARSGRTAAIPSTSSNIPMTRGCTSGRPIRGSAASPARSSSL